jgi:anti-sigma regulatory factor (Ser/Thr protein kinase)
VANQPLQRHSLTLPSGSGSADKGSAWARELAGKLGLSEDRITALDMCITELVSNVVDHSYREQPGEIRLQLDLGPPEAAILTVIDDGPEFDPLSVPPPKIPTSLDDAQVGGLGIHLVRSYADACEYKRRDGRNVFTAFFGARP